METILSILLLFGVQSNSCREIFFREIGYYASNRFCPSNSLQLNEEIRNRWLDFKFQVRFSRQSNGEVRAFLNDKEIVNYAGITSYSEHCGFFSKKNRYYFKMGLYRDRMLEPMSIYIDEYRKKEIVESGE